MLVPKGTVKAVASGTLDPAKQPLFSIAAANPQQASHFAQLGDTTDGGTAFAIEDLRLDRHSDRDYNDLIVRIGGATPPDTPSLGDVINSDLDWRPSELGQELLAFVSGDGSGSGDPPDIVAALANDTGFDNSDGITADPTIAGSITDASEIASFRAGFNDTELTDLVDVTPSLRPDGSFILARGDLETIAGAPLSDGVQTLHLQTFNGAGDVTDTLALTFSLDTDAPDAPHLDLPNAPDGLTHSTTPILEIQAEPGSQVDLFRDGLAVGTAPVNESGLAAIVPEPLSQGLHHLSATVTDVAGNVSPLSQSLTVTVDTVAPVAPLFDLDPAFDSAPLGDRVTAFETVTLVGQTEAHAAVELLEMDLLEMEKLSRAVTHPAGLQNRVCAFQHTRLLNRSVLVMHTGREPGRGSVDGVTSDCPAYCSSDSYPYGGFPSGHLSENTIRSGGIVLLDASAVWRPLASQWDAAPFCCSNTTNPRHRDCDSPAP